MRCSKLKKMLYNILVEEHNDRLLIKRYNTKLTYNLTGFYSNIMSLYKFLKKQFELTWNEKWGLKRQMRNPRDGYIHILTICHGL